MILVRPTGKTDRAQEAIMAISLRMTSDVAMSGVKMLCYGQSGAGKTTLIPTLPAPIVLSAEGGLLSIKDANLPYITIATMDDLREAYAFLRDSEEAKAFQSVAIDSISEVAEVVLNTEKKTSKDPRAAYGNMQEQMADLIRAFRDLPDKHVYMSAKLEKATDEMGRVMYAPSMPGQKMGQSMPFFFDFVFALRVERDADGNFQRALMVESDGLWQAKQRGGRLGAWESPDLGDIIKRVSE